MKTIGILGWEHEEYESVELKEVAEKTGYNAVLFYLEDVHTQMVEGKIKVTALGHDLRDFDVIISRAQLRPEHFQNDLQTIRMINEYTPNLVDNFQSFYLSGSKLLTLQQLIKHQIKIPDTFVCHTVDEVRQMWQQYQQIVMKPCYGYAGYDVERILDSFEEHSDVVEHLLQKYGSILVQQYIPHPDGDIRVTTLGDEELFSVRRIPNEATWKANVSLGASVAVYEPSETEKNIAFQAAKAVRQNIAGIDMIFYNGEYYVLEVNNVPGWYVLSKEQSEKTCQRIIDYCLGVVGRFVH